MSLLDYLRSAAKSETTVYTTFLQQYSKNDSAIHIFHEGKDDPSFYGNFIQNSVKKNQKVFYYQTKSKHNVYDNYRKMNWLSYSKKRILFFVDKDFSDILNIVYPVDTNIFVTSHYSIENYLVDKAVFSRSLRDIIALEDDRKNSMLSRQFQKGLKTFYESSLLLTAYILYHRKSGANVNLKNIAISDVITINRDYIVVRKSNILSVLDSRTGVVSKGIYRDIRLLLKTLQRINNPQSYTRGKFSLSYMISCINMTPEILNEGKIKGEKKYKCCVHISSNNAIQILAPRIRQPNDIKSFLKKAMK